MEKLYNKVKKSLLVTYFVILNFIGLNCYGGTTTHVHERRVLGI